MQMANRHSPLVGPDPLTPEWHELHRTTVSASRAAQACGVSEYGTPLGLYYEMTGQVEPFKGNKFTRRGQRYEPLVVEDYVELTGAKIKRYPCPMFIHSDLPFCTATPDVWVDEKSGWDIKTMKPLLAKKLLGEAFSDDIPTDWIFQGVQQCGIMGWDYVLFVVKFDFDEDPVPYRVDRNDELFSLIASAEEELIQRVKDRCPPPPDWSHASTPQLIRSIKGSIEDTRIEFTAEEVQIWEQYESLGKLETETKKHREVLQEKIRHVLKSGNHFAGLLPDGRMVRRKWIDSEVKAHTRKFESLIAVKADDGRIVPRETPIESSKA